MKKTFLSVLAFVLLTQLGHAQDVPVFKISPIQSTIKFYVKSSVDLTGVFDKWEATAIFTSPDVTTCVLDIKISASSVNTGSGFKNDKLKSKDFFDVSQNPTITFHSTKVTETSPTTFDIAGDFTIRGVTKPVILQLTIASGKGTGHAMVTGTMAFDRKDYGMNSNIPFIKIADRVEVNVALKADQVSGPKVVYKQ
jgi:polyisoprenoid-binding protein YceI